MASENTKTQPVALWFGTPALPTMVPQPGNRFLQKGPPAFPRIFSRQSRSLPTGRHSRSLPTGRQYNSLPTGRQSKSLLPGRECQSLPPGRHSIIGPWCVRTTGEHRNMSLSRPGDIASLSRPAERALFFHSKPFGKYKVYWKKIISDHV